MEAAIINGNTVRVSDGDFSLLLMVDKENGLISVRGDGPPQVDPQMRMEIDVGNLSVSLFNHSDLGLTVDNNGVTTIHEASLFASTLKLVSNPSGIPFRVVVDDNGVLSTVPA